MPNQAGKCSWWKCLLQQCEGAIRRASDPSFNSGDHSISSWPPHWKGLWKGRKAWKSAQIRCFNLIVNTNHLVVRVLPVYIFALKTGIVSVLALALFIISHCNASDWDSLFWRSPSERNLRAIRFCALSQNRICSHKHETTFWEYAYHFCSIHLYLSNKPILHTRCSSTL